MTKFSMRHQPPDMWIKSRTQPVTLFEIMRRYNMTEDSANRMVVALERDRKIVRLHVDGETRWGAPQRARTSV